MSWPSPMGFTPVGGSAWQILTAPNGRPYYYNPLTRTTQWENPDELKSPQDRLTSSPWKEYTSPDGRKYYHNTITKETKWDRPAELNGTSNHSINSTSSNNMMMTIPEAQQETFTEDDGPTYATHEEAIKAFKSLLSEKGIEPNWTWEQTMRATVKEPRYRALKSLKDRKAVFSEYLTERRMQIEKEETENLKKQRKDLLELMEKDARITVNTRYKTAKKLLADEPAFKEFNNEIERERCFKQRLREWQEQEVERIANKRKKNMEDFATLLQELDISYNTTWEQAQKIYEASEEYKNNPDLQSMDKIDFLSVFEVHIMRLEREVNERRQKEKQARIRRERKSREAYVSMLKRLRDEGVINSRTKWMDLYPRIKESDEYKNMLEQLGSSPLEYLWDIIEDLSMKLYEQRRKAESVLKDANITVEEDIDGEKITSLLKSDSRTKDISDTDIPLIIEALKDKAARRKRDEQRRAERKLRYAIDDLRSTIKHLDPPITLEDKWEDVRLRVESLPTFKALVSEEDRITAFEKHRTRLQQKVHEREIDTGLRNGDRKRKSTSRHHQDESKSLKNKHDHRRHSSREVREGSFTKSSHADDDSSSDEEEQDASKRIKRESVPEDHKPPLKPDSESEEGEIH